MNIIYSDFKEQWGNHIFYNTVNFQPVTFRILFFRAMFRGIQTLQMRLSRKACFWWTQLLRPFCRAADEIMFPSSWRKKIPFFRSVESWHAYPYSTCRQVEISFLGMPQIAHFQVEKWKSSLLWEGGHPPPTPSPARSLRSLARIAPPPKCFGSLRHCSPLY